jgi:hypothetical protein
VGCARHVIAALERGAQGVGAPGRLILPRRYPDHARKKALQVKRTDVNGRAQLRERQALLRIGVQHFARPFDYGELAGQAGRLASLARAIPGGFGVCGGIEEFDVLPARRPRRARRAAEHTGGAYGVEKRAIGARVAAGNGVPAGGIIGKSGRGRGGFHHNPHWAQGT